MDVYPLFLKIAGRPCLLVGGGAAAERKAELLMRAGARLTIVAERLTPGLARAAGAGRLRHLAAPLGPEQFRGQALVVVASEDEALAREASVLAHGAGVPVNVVDRPELSTCIAGAVVDRSPVLVAITTGGAAPVLARELRLAIERLLPPSLGRLAAFAERFRAAAKAALPSPRARRRFWERFFASALAKAVLAGDEAGAQAAMVARVNRGEMRGEDVGIVHLVGAGPGDPELLTLRAHRLLAEADTIVYDRLVDPAVLELGRRDAERIHVGKAAGRHSLSQDEINALLARLASQGKRVVRLKGGDPFVFGRGGEELEALRARGIAVAVVPGVTAALGCAAAAEIPLTYRGLASAVTFVTASQRDGGELDWAALARLPGTLAIYMGVSQAERIAERLVAHGRRPATPVALVENGTRQGERVIVGKLGELAALVEAHGIGAPALIVVGEVVRLAKPAALPALPLAASA